MPISRKSFNGSEPLLDLSIMPPTVDQNKTPFSNKDFPAITPHSRCTPLLSPAISERFLLESIVSSPSSGYLRFQRKYLEDLKPTEERNQPAEAEASGQTTPRQQSRGPVDPRQDVSIGSRKSNPTQRSESCHERPSRPLSRVAFEDHHTSIADSAKSSNGHQQSANQSNRQTSSRKSVGDQLTEVALKLHSGNGRSAGECGVARSHAAPSVVSRWTSGEPKDAELENLMELSAQREAVRRKDLLQKRLEGGKFLTEQDKEFDALTDMIHERSEMRLRDLGDPSGNVIETPQSSALFGSPHPSIQQAMQDIHIPMSLPHQHSHYTSKTHSEAPGLTMEDDVAADLREAAAAAIMQAEALKESIRASSGRLSMRSVPSSSLRQPTHAVSHHSPSRSVHNQPSTASDNKQSHSVAPSDHAQSSIHRGLSGQVPIHNLISESLKSPMPSNTRHSRTPSAAPSGRSNVGKEPAPIDAKSIHPSPGAASARNNHSSAGAGSARSIHPSPGAPSVHTPARSASVRNSSVATHARGLSKPGSARNLPNAGGGTPQVNSGASRAPSISNSRAPSDAGNLKVPSNAQNSRAPSNAPSSRAAPSHATHSGAPSNAAKSRAQSNVAHSGASSLARQSKGPLNPESSRTLSKAGSSRSGHPTGGGPGSMHSGGAAGGGPPSIHSRDAAGGDPPSIHSGGVDGGGARSIHSGGGPPSRHSGGADGGGPPSRHSGGADGGGPPSRHGGSADGGASPSMNDGSASRVSENKVAPEEAGNSTPRHAASRAPTAASSRGEDEGPPKDTEDARNETMISERPESIKPPTLLDDQNADGLVSSQKSATVNEGEPAGAGEEGGDAEQNPVAQVDGNGEEPAQEEAQEPAAPADENNGETVTAQEEPAVDENALIREASNAGSKAGEIIGDAEISPGPGDNIGENRNVRQIFPGLTNPLGQWIRFGRAGFRFHIYATHPVSDICGTPIPE